MCPSTCTQRARACGYPSLHQPCFCTRSHLSGGGCVSVKTNIESSKLDTHHHGESQEQRLPLPHPSGRRPGGRRPRGPSRAASCWRCSSRARQSESATPAGAWPSEVALPPRPAASAYRPGAGRCAPDLRPPLAWTAVANRGARPRFRHPERRAVQPSFRSHVGGKTPRSACSPWPLSLSLSQPSAAAASSSPVVTSPDASPYSPARSRSGRGTANVAGARRAAPPTSSRSHPSSIPLRQSSRALVVICSQTQAAASPSSSRGGRPLT